MFLESQLRSAFTDEKKEKRKAVHLKNGWNTPYYHHALEASTRGPWFLTIFSCQLLGDLKKDWITLYMYVR